MLVSNLGDIIVLSFVALIILATVLGGIKAWAEKNRTVGCIAIVIVAALICVAAAPVRRVLHNRYDEVLRRADDSTSYITRKEVEGYCRSAVVNYLTNKMLYEQYKGSDNPRHRDWAEQAKGEANRIAASYNEYLLKNSFVFAGNVPDDIDESLEYIQ